MSEVTRDPAGKGEVASGIALFGAIGVWLAGLVDDPNLTNVILIGTTVVGNVLLGWLRNQAGGPLLGKLGFGPSKGTLLSALAAAGAAVWLLGAAPGSAVAAEIEVKPSFNLSAAGWGIKLYDGSIDFGVGIAGVGVGIETADGARFPAVVFTRPWLNMTAGLDQAIGWLAKKVQ